MKVEKINAEIVKDYFKNKIYGLNTKYQLAEGENVVGVMDESNAIYLLQSHQVIFDVDKFLKEVTPFKLDNILKSEKDYEPAFITGNKKVLSNKRVVVEFKKKDSDDVAYVDEKYLKYFEEYTVKIINIKSPLFIYENDTLVGIVCPVHVNKVGD